MATNTVVLVACPDCDGEGRVGTGRFAPTADKPCDRCLGEGRIDPAELDGEA